MNKRPALLLGGIVLAALLALGLYGCADMPITTPPPGEDLPIGDAQLALGPYLTSGDGMQPFMRFVSNRRTVAGIQAMTDNRKYISRQASFSLFHSLAIPALSEETKPYQLWLGDQDGGAYGIRGLPRRGMAVGIGFAGGDAANNRLYGVGNVLRMLDLNAVVFTSPPFQGGVPYQPVDWETMFFAPLGDKVAFGPMWFVPGSGLPKELFPENAAEGGYWKRDVGALRIIGMDARAFSFESSRQAIIDRLQQDLDPRHADRAWTVVVLSRSAFDARVGDGRILGALGDILERGGVDLVIGQGDYYMRTRPFSSGGAGQTRYISIADTPTVSPSALVAREYVAAISGTPHVARLWADEGTLEWQVVDLAGRPMDLLTLEAPRAHLEAPMSLEMAMQDASSSLSLQREILRMTRQAAKAVPNPNDPQLLTLTFANPTTRPFSGIMRWSVPPGSGWQIEPLDMPFTLQPGQGAAARFAVIAGANLTPAQLTVSVPDIGSSTEPLLITRQRVYDVRKAPEEIRIDARFRDKNYWRSLPVLAEFQLPDGNAPDSPTEARVTADRNGLIIAVSMAAKNASQVNPPASDPELHRDGPVLEDESIEIFIDPHRDGRDFFQFALNPRNVILDTSSRAGTSYNPNWRRVVRFGRIGDIETWDAEMRIPWEALGLAEMPKQGDEWGFQMVRRDYAGKRENMGRRRGKNYVQPAPQVSQWVLTGGDNTRPGLYGVLRFGDMTDAPEAADTGRRATAPGVLIRGGGLLPGRLPTGSAGGFLPPPSTIPEPPAPDM
ncbi:MAG: hypothetical protein LUC93_05185 [Planctomycetaceae bacterium]|nr:hypothetical protein [Planctomycetaceae bacterium]